MDCESVRVDPLPHERGQLARTRHEDVRAHLERCGKCAKALAVERALTGMLEERLPQFPASLALKRRLAVAWPSAPVATVVVDALGAPARAGVGGCRGARGGYPALPRASGRGAGAGEHGDHLRILLSDRPLEVKAEEMHQVKPWFTGHLDFAPVVGTSEGETRLEGGAVGYFLDRRAAVFVYKTRLHTISLFVFRADGLAWPERALTPMGPVQARTEVVRGFNVLLWRSGALGYALVSDVNAQDLREVGAKVAG